MKKMFATLLGFIVILHVTSVFAGNQPTHLNIKPRAIAWIKDDVGNSLVVTANPGQQCGRNVGFCKSYQIAPPPTNSQSDIEEFEDGGFDLDQYWVAFKIDDGYDFPTNSTGYYWDSGSWNYETGMLIHSNNRSYFKTIIPHEESSIPGATGFAWAYRKRIGYTYMWFFYSVEIEGLDGPY